MVLKRIFKFLFILSYVNAAAQNPVVFDRTETFRPLLYPDAGTGTRSADGRPGPQYWQNQADYDIDVILDTVNDKISGQVSITYTNNSPLPLDFLWLQLDQNFKKKDSRYIQSSLIAASPQRQQDLTEGFRIESVFINQKKKKSKADFLVDDTRMQIRLPDPVASKGGKITVIIQYNFTIPETGGNRMGITKTAKGKIYEVAQWYPRMAVYDDVEGWNTVPYQIGCEFYLPFGNYRYTITAPANMIIAGSGSLLNERDVLSPGQLKKLEAAKKSDETVIIDDGLAATASGEKTWRFSCNNSRDAAWAASAAFIWDAARINLPGDKKSLAMSLYPEESATSEGWKNSTQFTKAAVEMYSGKWFVYPYPYAINVAGTVDGMEYPGIVFCAKDATASSLWEVTAHEFGHNWFPMIVGSNERKYAWMDEGITSFITGMITREYANGKYNLVPDSLAGFQIKRLFAPSVLPVMNTPMMTMFTENYWKPAVALKLLREEVLGPERFDFGMRSYIKNWAFKHPTPWDFFRIMENSAGEDLGWFWRAWFLNNWKLDQRIKGVTYVDDKDLTKGVRIVLDNNEKMVMPVTLKITQAGGKTEVVKLPVELWQKGHSWTYWYPSTSAVVQIEIDPLKKLPDIDRSNNFWKN